MYIMFVFAFLGSGTGNRHAVRRWPTSVVTGRSHKLVIPAENPDKKVFFCTKH